MPGEGIQLGHICNPNDCDMQLWLECGAWAGEGRKDPGDHIDSFCQSPRETLGFWPKQHQGPEEKGHRGWAGCLWGMEDQAANSQARNPALHTLYDMTCDRWGLTQAREVLVSLWGCPVSPWVEGGNPSPSRLLGYPGPPAGPIARL